MEKERYSSKVCITGKETLERLVRLETINDQGEKALVLKRQLDAEKEKSAKIETDRHFANLNQAKEKLDKVEGLLATKENLANVKELINVRISSEVRVLEVKIEGVEKAGIKALEPIKRLVWIGVGIAITCSAFIGFVFYILSKR